MYIVVLNLPLAHELQNYTRDLQVKLYQVRSKLNISNYYYYYYYYYFYLKVIETHSPRAVRYRPVGHCLVGIFEYVHNMLAGLS